MSPSNVFTLLKLNVTASNFETTKHKQINWYQEKRLIFTIMWMWQRKRNGLLIAELVKIKLQQLQFSGLLRRSWIVESGTPIYQSSHVQLELIKTDSCALLSSSANGRWCLWGFEKPFHPAVWDRDGNLSGHNQTVQQDMGEYCQGVCLCIQCSVCCVDYTVCWFV